MHRSPQLSLTPPLKLLYLFRPFPKLLMDALRTAWNSCPSKCFWQHYQSLHVPYCCPGSTSLTPMSSLPISASSVVHDSCPTQQRCQSSQPVPLLFSLSFAPVPPSFVDTCVSSKLLFITFSKHLMVSLSKRYEGLKTVTTSHSPHSWNFFFPHVDPCPKPADPPEFRPGTQCSE